MMIIRILKWFNSGQSRRWLFLSTVSQLNWNLECCFLWRGKNWRTQRKTLGAGMRTNNKLSPYGARSGNWTSVRVSQQIMHLVEFKMNYAKYMLYFYQVFLECEIVSKAKYCSWMGKRQRVDFYSCFLFIAPQKFIFCLFQVIHTAVCFFSESSFKTPAISSFIPCFFIYKFQSADQSSYKEKYFTLLSAMKQIQNTFLRAQQNAEKNVKGIS